MAYHGQGVNIDVVYPDPEPLSKPGPHLSALQQAYYEEHGVLPVPELTRDLLDTFWKSIHRDNAEECVKGVEGGVNTQPPEANLREPRQLNVHQNVSNQAQRVPNRDGPIYFAQNRLELVPFLGASPAEVYSGHLPVSMVSSSPCPQYVGSDFDLAAISPLPICNRPVTHPAASAQHTGQYGAGVHHGSTGLAQSPMSRGVSLAENVTRFNSRPVVTTRAVLPAAYQAARGKAVVKTGATKDQWLPGEIHHVIHLRDNERKNWAEILQILGRHTELSITDKYYSSKRKAKGEKG